VRAYVITTGLVFALLAVVHAWRFVEEGRGVLNPFFVAITLVAAALSLWAWRVSRKI
jgi:hypothetical protein